MVSIAKRPNKSRAKRTLNRESYKKKRFIMFEIEKVANKRLITNVCKYLTANESQFLNKLYFWSSHNNNYGIVYESQNWIYNTLDKWAIQLNTSKSSARRAIKSLKEKNMISSNFLSANTRNRTLYYSLNFETLEMFMAQKKSSAYAQKIPCIKKINEHMRESMLSNNSTYKSNKSIINKIISRTQDEQFEKPTIIQDMIAICKEEFPNLSISLSKQLARYMVASFQLKFKSSIELWRKYLKLIKTSTYLIGEKFKLSFNWILKFVTIDRLFAGDLGVKPNEIEFQEKKQKQSLDIKLHLRGIRESELDSRISDLHEIFHKKLGDYGYKSNFIENPHEILIEKDKIFDDYFIIIKTEDRVINKIETLGYQGINYHVKYISFNEYRKKEVEYNKIFQEINDLEESECCKKTRKSLFDRVGGEWYILYFLKSRFIEKNNKSQIIVDEKYMQESLKKAFVFLDFAIDVFVENPSEEYLSQDNTETIEEPLVAMKTSSSTSMNTFEYFSKSLMQKWRTAYI